MTDEGWLPPDQIATRKWPVVGERAPAVDAPAEWPLEVAGLVARPLKIALAELDAEAEELVMDVHCVTRWSHRGMRFGGVPLARVLERAGVADGASHVRFLAWSERDHDTGLPLDVAVASCWLVRTANGAPLPREHGGPLRVVTVGRYFYKSLKWLRRVELLDAPHLGYWERTDGYHDNADPWPGDERYVGGNLTDAELERLRAGTNLARWHGRTVRRADLRGWRPATRSLGRLQLKRCDLREADLRGADLAGANLTLSDLRGADLRGADLRGSDLEGADLRGADLREADLTWAALTAATFVGEGLAAQVRGMRWEGVTGLLEDQEAWLRAEAP